MTIAPAPAPAIHRPHCLRHSTGSGHWSTRVIGSINGHRLALAADASQCVTVLPTWRHENVGNQEREREKG
ncbi:hypothetical protein TYRP_012954 [Tyrophagus putrescentiae]|nr:hypothetical protein TYRP_012954 [Tyrophagus putrescentiae]